MKECKYCGTMYEDKEKICPGCGGSIVITDKDIKIEEEMLAEMNPEVKKKMPLGKKLLIVMSVAVLIIAAIAVVNIISNNKVVTTDGKTNGDLDDEYKQAVEYIADEEYEKAINILSNIPEEYSDYDRVVKKQEEAIKGFEEDAIEKASKLAEKGQYVQAVEVIDVALGKLDGSKKLQNEKKNILDSCKNSYLSEAQKYADMGDYATAISQLETFITTIGEDEDANEKILEYKIAQVTLQLQQYEAEQNYAVAIDYLSAQLPNVSNDAQLTSKLAELKSTYKKSSMDAAASSVSNGDYNAAITALNTLKKSLGEDSEVNAKILEYERALSYNEAQQYANTGNYAAAIKRLETFISANGSDADVQAKILEYKKTQISVTVQEYEGAGNYSAAISYLQKQLSSVDNDSQLTAKLSDLWSLYKSSCMTTAENSAVAGNYDEAIATLSALKVALGNDADVDAKILEYKKARINAKLAAFDVNADYAGAILYLNGQLSVVNNDVELKSKLDLYKTNYKTKLLADAESAYQSEGFEKAVRILSEGVGVLNNDSEIVDKIAYYESKRPIALGEIKEYQNSWRYYGSKVTDIVGNTYNGYYCGVYGDGVLYYLNNEFNLLEFKFVQLEAKKGETGADREITITNDDTGEVLYHKVLDLKEEEGVTVSIDVSQVKFLKMSIKGCYYSGTKIYAAMVDAYLIK